MYDVNAQEYAHMDIKGYEKVVRALEDAGIESEVAPQPAEGEDVRFVTIETHDSFAPSHVLNALHQASLLHQASVDPKGLTLRCVSAVPEAVTLEDEQAIKHEVDIVVQRTDEILGRALTTQLDAVDALLDDPDASLPRLEDLEPPTYEPGEG